jgi:hypothetical protein
VSLSLSTTRPFDAPKFVLNLKYRHPVRGHCFCPRVLYSLNSLFWPISGTLQLPLPTRGATLVSPPEKRTRKWFPIPFRNVAVPFVRIEVDLPFPLFSLFP